MHFFKEHLLSMRRFKDSSDTAAWYGATILKSMSPARSTLDEVREEGCLMVLMEVVEAGAAPQAVQSLW